MTENETYKKPGPIWLLASDVTIVEAALLLLDIEPQEIAEEVDRWSDAHQPAHYRAAKQSILSAIINGEIPGRLIALDGANIEVGDSVPYHVFDAASSHVDLFTFRNWVEDRGYQSDFLSFPKGLPDVSDPEHPRYAPKLAAAIAAWENFSDVEDATGSVKQRLERWLRLNASRFDLVDDEGNPQETVIKSIARVVNWNTAGGAPPMDQREIEPE